VDNPNVSELPYQRNVPFPRKTGAFSDRSGTALILACTDRRLKRHSPVLPRMEGGCNIHGVAGKSDGASR